MKVACSLIVRSVAKKLVKKLEKKGMNDHVKKLPIVPAHAPDVKRGIDHFCFDTSGNAVVDGLCAHCAVALDVTSPS